MAGTGPAPSPTSRRQTGTLAHTWTDLPASGREGDPPTWPLKNQSERESEIWADIWATPQAVAWERLGWLHEVALYVRTLVAAEGGDLKSTTEARQWSDRLGLNPTSMLKNRWRIARDEVSEQRSTRRTQRRRLVVADAVEA